MLVVLVDVDGNWVFIGFFFLVGVGSLSDVFLSLLSFKVCC